MAYLYFKYKNHNLKKNNVSFYISKKRSSLSNLEFCHLPGVPASNLDGDFAYVEVCSWT